MLDKLDGLKTKVIRQSDKAKLIKAGVKAKEIIYIGRKPNELGRHGWGNPVAIDKKKGLTRQVVLRIYYAYLREKVCGDRLFFEKLAVILWGRILACHCHPDLCHGHMLAKAAEYAHETLRDNKTPTYEEFDAYMLDDENMFRISFFTHNIIHVHQELDVFGKTEPKPEQELML